MTTQHIPGPWYLKEYEDSIVICRQWDSDVKPGEAKTYGSYLGAHIAEVKHQGSTAPVVTLWQARANAKFIATAPDMFKALIAQEIAEANDQGEDILPMMEAIGAHDVYLDPDIDLHVWAKELRHDAIIKASTPDLSKAKGQP